MEESRRRYLRIALMLVGVAFLLFYPLMYLWPSGFQWTPRQSEYEQMIAAVYATLGVFLLLASRRPEAHASLIWFTVWSSIVHGGLMAVQAVVERVDGGPFAPGTEPWARFFRFDTALIEHAANRVVFTCRTCDAGVVLLGVVEDGVVTCRCCQSQMSRAS